MAWRTQILVSLVMLAAGQAIVAQGVHRATVGPKFSDLTPEDSERLHQQRAVVAAQIKQRYGSSLTRTKKDLPLLQRLIDEKAFQKSQTYELQSLGVAFGDVLARELSLHWVMVTDEYGSDPTLRFKNTTINMNALTMISKRVERGEDVDVARLLQQSREGLAAMQRQLYGPKETK